MGQRELLAAGLALTALAIGAARPLPAQGPLHRERWGHLHLELRRQEVLRELAGRDLATRQQATVLLQAPDEGVPFRPVAQALAFLRKAECDDAFQFRTGLCAFVLPEVVDPAGDHEECRSLQLSLGTPFPLPQRDPVRFLVTVQDAAGAAVFQGVIDRDTGAEDLRMARAHLAVPCAELPDGAYEVWIAAELAHEGPRPRDPVLRHRFFVHRGYAERARAALERAAEAVARLGDPDAALLRGLGAQVHRAFSGEAGDGPSEAMAELERLERALANLQAGAAPLHGLRGGVTAALPAGGEHLLAVTLRLPPDGEPRPLVVLVAGAPAYDATGRRPAAPATRGPRWLHDQCEAAFPADRFHLAAVESPGGGFHFADGLERALPVLRRLLPGPERDVVLVLEREAAVAMCFRPDALRRLCRGVVLVTGGALSREALAALGDLRILACPMSGHPGGDGLLRTADLVAGKFGEVAFAGSFELEPGDGQPWILGAAALTRSIAAFARRLADR